MTEFYVIMLKRQDGKVYADLHKTNQHIYLTIEDAYDEWNNNEHYKQYFHIVKLIACLDGELKEIKDQLDYLEQRAFDKEDFDYQTYIEDYK
jgi:hypothetical protein